MNISRPVRSLAEAYWYAKLIMQRDRSTQSGRLYEADGEWGSWVRMSAGNGQPWRALGIRNADLAVAGIELLNGRLYIRREAKAYDLQVPFTTLGSIVGIGPTHHLIGHPVGSEAIGMFTFHPADVSASDDITFPSLWAANAQRQKRILAAPTHQGEPLPDKDDDDLKVMLGQRSDLFISRNARMTSQALAAARTDEQMMGGRAWTALLCDDEAVKSALVIWLNSTLSAIVRTCYAQTTQPGRATMQINALGGFPVPDFAADSDGGAHARAVAAEHIEALSLLGLQPLAYAFDDQNRKAIDHVALDMLGLGGNADAEAGLDWLRRIWCKEPSTHGGNASIMADAGVTPDGTPPFEPQQGRLLPC